jgi:alpha-methylacyl-CoA racemase
MSLLDGVRVLDLSSVGPAARASRWLADYGAQVTKVKPKDASKQLTPPFYAYSAHRGMDDVAFDLPADANAFLDLAAEADVVIESFRPGVVARLGVGYDAVSARNPRIVYCSTTGYGQTGPWSQWAGHDLNYLGVGGYLHCSGPAATSVPGLTIADSAGGGMHAVMSILAALVQRATSGRGTYLDVSVADGMLALMALNVDEYLAVGIEPGPGHSLLTGRFACYGVYECGDGKWLTVAAIEPRFWENLCTALDLAKWIPHQTDDAAQVDIRADMAVTFRTKSRDEWVAELGGADTCVGPVLSVPEIVVNEQFTARGAFVDAPGGEYRQVAKVLAGQ